MGSSRIFSWWSIAVVGISAAVFSLLSFPHPELDWEGAVLPDAQKYMQEMGVATPSAEQPLEGLVVAVTGATSGIGLELTRKLAKLGATVLAIGRSPKKLQQLQDDIPGVQTVVANLADLASVADASDYMLDKYDHLDVLINNAGIHQGLNGMWEFPVTEQGYDMAFGVNYLAHFLLTEKLMPLLKQSRKPKILQISSSYHWAVDGSDLRTASANGENPVASHPGGSHGFVVYRTQRQYASSKLAQILQARSVQARHNVTTVSACPAWVGTQIAGKDGSVAHSLLQLVTFPANGYGLSSILFALLDTASGKASDYYINTGVVHGPNPLDSMPSWMYERLPLRDMVVNSCASLLMLSQRFFPVRKATFSSLVSYDEALQDDLYEWSQKAISEWL